MKLSEDLLWRGLIKDKTFADITWLDAPKTFYHGVDVGSADSLQVGNLAAMMLARRLLEAGWKTVLLVGGATSLIGDPGGKDEERALVSREQVEHNKAGILAQMKLLFAGKNFELVDNYDWFKDILYLEFLREVGKNFSMTELIQRDFVADRMGEGGSGISYAEFSYSLVQGYDFWEINKLHGAVLQIGGSDQWANMITGIPLIRKKEGIEAHALSMPLIINKTTGKKFGKSEGGAVWLDRSKTSVYKFYQFWLNTGDDSVEDYLKVYTLLTRPEIEQLMTEFRAQPQKRAAQKRLALEVTALVHGTDEAETQVRIAAALFGERPLTNLSVEELQTVRDEIPHVEASGAVTVVAALVSSGLATSNSEARRLEASGAVYVNGQKATVTELRAGDYPDGRLLLRRGKALKDTALIELR